MSHHPQLNIYTGYTLDVFFPALPAQDDFQGNLDPYFPQTGSPLGGVCQTSPLP